jgi:hypothetical protein
MSASASSTFDVKTYFKERLPLVSTCPELLSNTFVFHTLPSFLMAIHASDFDVLRATSKQVEAALDESMNVLKRDWAYDSLANTAHESMRYSV